MDVPAPHMMITTSLHPFSHPSGDIPLSERMFPHLVSGSRKYFRRHEAVRASTSSDMDASKLTIVECTVDQARQTRRNTFTTWGEPGGFDEAWWIHRFETLEKDVWAEGDRYKCW